MNKKQTQIRNNEENVCANNDERRDENLGSRVRGERGLKTCVVMAKNEGLISSEDAF